MSSATSTIPLSLSDRRNELTRKLILDAAIEALESAPVSELTMRLVAKRAAMSERTVFRYFATREAFLDAVADEVVARLGSPPPPRSLEELMAYPRALYERFEATARLVRASLHSSLVNRIRERQGKSRWIAVRKLVDRIAPHSSDHARKIASANIRFYLAGSAWDYYRFTFGFGLEDTIACAETAIRSAIESLDKPALRS
jgi:AcrR family transcriptional regulator